jgi:hypothetical protein
MMFYIPEGICFAAFVALSCNKNKNKNKKRQAGKHAHKNQETNEKIQQKNTNENMHSVTTFKKGQKSLHSHSFRNIKVKQHTYLKMAM